MSKVLYLASLEAGDGKTALGAALAQRWQRSGKRVEYLKPVVVQSAGDAELAHEALLFARRTLGLTTPSPKPIVVNVQSPDSPPLRQVQESIKAACQDCIATNDIALVEGHGGLATLSLQREVSRAAVQALDARVLLVAGFTWQMAREPVLSAAEMFGGALGGVVINKVPRLGGQAASEMAAALKEAGIRVLGLIPEIRTMFGISVRDLVSKLKGRYVLEVANGDALVENILVGANVLDAPGYPAGPIYFGLKDKKAVIAKGDRPDFQWAALDTATQCLILTGNYQPIPYVIEKAKERGIPLAVVEQDTLDTLHMLEEVLATPRFDQESKLEMFRASVEESLDLNLVDELVRA